jgi:hypothetical protein
MLARHFADEGEKLLKLVGVDAEFGLFEENDFLSSKLFRAVS